MLHKNTLQHIFNEGIYIQKEALERNQPEPQEEIGLIGNKDAAIICFLLSAKNTEANEAQLDLLKNIMSAISVKEGRYCISYQWSEKLGEAYEYVFIFGTSNDLLNLNTPLNKFYGTKLNFFRTYGVEELVSNKTLKQNLWNGISPFKDRNNPKKNQK